MNGYKFVNELNKINNAFLFDLNECIKEYIKTYSKNAIANYFVYDKKCHEDLATFWNKNKDKDGPLDDYGFKNKNRKIIDIIAHLASLIKKLSGVSWMTFMVQDPAMRTDLENKAALTSIEGKGQYVLINFGIPDHLRGSWDNELEKQQISMTDLLFGQNIIRNKICCFRIRPKNNPKNDDILYLTYSKSGQKSHITLSSNTPTEEKMRIAEELQEKINTAKQNNAFDNYVDFMEKFTENADSPFNIYAIPIVSVSLFYETSSKSGMFLVSKNIISSQMLSQIQNMLTNCLCHIDYIRAAIKQRASDFRLTTHDLKESIVYVENAVRELNNPTVENHIRIIASIITAFQAGRSDGKNSKLSMYDGFYGNSNWISLFSELARTSVPAWKTYTSIPKTNISSESLRYSVSAGGNLIDLFITTFLVVIKNAWKHQCNYYVGESMDEDDIRNEDGISIDICESSKKNQMIFIFSNKVADNKVLDQIAKRKIEGEGTFAVIAFLISLMNNHINNQELNAEFKTDFNNVKCEFVQMLYFPKYILKTIS
ncbi:MAG: hypothetical protein Q7J31_04510 [Syntrophales bacterium]|nr:hypothetical protein [Syntrophales bacterium]